MKEQRVHSNYQRFKNDFLRIMDVRGRDPERLQDNPLSCVCEKIISRMMSSDF